MSDRRVLEARAHLMAGELVAIPTETVYGLAGNGFVAETVSKIFAVKNRPTFDPLILHTDSLSKIEAWIGELSPLAHRLAVAFWPGPMTLVLPTSSLIPDLVTSGLPSVAFRIPAHPLTLELLSLLPFPLAAPSANPFGYISPTRAEHVANQLGGQVAYILDGGPCAVGVESTIVSCVSDPPAVLRLGGLTLSRLQSVVKEVAVRPHSSSRPEAPGMLESHYAPCKPFFLGDLQFLLEQHQDKGCAVLGFGDLSKIDTSSVVRLHNLSPSGSLAEAAQNLFAYMRLLDDCAAADCILAAPLPERGLGRAINDRLRRAAGSK
ncbi:MAG: L-threonylcarbamoyladenylate synthase [Bernardetiaceae bacterium]